MGPFVLNVKKRDADGAGGPFRDDGNVLTVLNLGHTGGHTRLSVYAKLSNCVLKMDT